MWFLAVLVLSSPSFLHMIAASRSEAGEGARNGQHSPCWWAEALPVLRVGLGEQNAKWSQGQCRAQSPSSKPQTLQTGGAQHLPAAGLWLWHFGFFPFHQNTPCVAGNGILGRRLRPSERHFWSLSAQSVFSYPCKCSAGGTDENIGAVWRDEQGTNGCHKII